jgi:hypothetical protein
MDLDAADVPELIEALADRYALYGITPQQARRITLDILERAFSELEEFEDATRVTDHAYQAARQRRTHH